MTSSLKAGGAHPSTLLRLQAPAGLQQGHYDSKFNEGAIFKVGAGPIPSNTVPEPLSRQGEM